MSRSLLELGPQLEAALREVEQADAEPRQDRVYDAQVDLLCALRPLMRDATAEDMCTALPTFLDARMKLELGGMTVEEALQDGVSPEQLLTHVEAVLKDAPEAFARALPLMRLRNKRQREQQQSGSPRTAGAGPLAPEGVQQPQQAHLPAASPLQPAAAPAEPAPLINTSGINSRSRVRPRLSGDGASLGRDSAPFRAEQQQAEPAPAAIPPPPAPAPAAVVPARALRAPAPDRGENEYAAALRAACEATPELTEPLAWAVLAFAEMLQRNTAARGDAPSPADSPEELREAMQLLAAMGRHHLPYGALLAKLAVDGFAGAWMRRERALPCCSELAGGLEPPFKLRHVVGCLKERLPPPREEPGAAPAAPPPAQPPPGTPVFTLAPSLLGRFRQLSSCSRFLHLKAEFTRRHNVSDGGGGGKRAAALLKDGSATEAILQKGMYWEAALTDMIACSPPPACLAPPGRELPGGPTSVRDLALEAFRAAVLPGSKSCLCGHTEETRLGADFQEKRHGNPKCEYHNLLLDISRKALLGESPGVCLYQAKFEVPQQLYTRNGVDRDVLRFTNFQPDYVYVLPGDAPGSRELAVVDAKASAHVKVSHRVQVAAYAWALAALLEEGPLAAPSRVADVGAIWRPGCAAPDVFPLAEPMRQHEEALAGPLSREVLTREAYAKTLERPAELAYGQEWQLRASCASCEFLAQCRAQAVRPRKLASVPGVGPAAVKALREMADIEDVPGLVTWLRDPSTPAVVKAAVRDPKLRRGAAALAALAPAGMADEEPEAPLDERVRAAAASTASPCAFSPRLTAALEDRVVVRPHAVCTALPGPQPPGGMPEDIVAVSLLSDPTTGEAYAWAVQTFTARPGQPLLRAAADGGAKLPAVAVAPRAQFVAAEAYEPPPPTAEQEELARAAKAEAASPDGGITLGRGAALRRGLVAELHAALCGPSTRVACAVMLDGGERAAVLSLLFAVATSSLAAEADLRVAAQCCLFACLDARLLAADRAVNVSSEPQLGGRERFRQLHAADSPSMAALLPALPALLEIPALGFVTLADVATHVAAAAPAFQGPHGAGADSLRDFILGPDADFGSRDSLEATVGALDGDAAYRDWGARAVGGERRVAELAVRRCRLAAATLDGLRALLDAAGGAASYLPLSAAKRGAALQIQPFDSAACARAALFKCIELRAAGVAGRAERARPLAARMRKGNTLLVKVTALATVSDNECRITCQLVPEADGGAPVTAADKLLSAENLKYTNWLLAPLSRDGLLSTLRFPEAALAHVGGYTGKTVWEKFPEEAHALRAGLRLGALAPKDLTLQRPDDPAQAVTLTLRVYLAGAHSRARFTALEPGADCAVGKKLLLFGRDADVTGPKVANHARTLVDCPRGGPSAWLRDLQPYQEVIAVDVTLENGASLGNCVAHFLSWGDASAEGEAPDDRSDDGAFECARLLVTASDTSNLTEPREVAVQARQIVHRFSLFRTLFDTAAEQGVLLPPFDPAAVSPAGAWACGLDASVLKPMVSLIPEGGQDPLAEVLRMYATQFTPTASQRESFERVVTHRLSAVWGPPGSGKTHFSAGMLLALFSAYSRAFAPLRVLVCSQTKAATRVLLRKVSGEAEKLIHKGGLKPGYIELFTTDEEGESEDPKPLVPIEAAPGAAALWSHERCVVGATVWQAHKTFSASAASKNGLAAPKFDLILVDEASQLLACDAMMVVDLLDPFSGRLVAVGDHLQMPPVIRGTGYPAGTAGCPSPAASLLEAVRGALKAGGLAAAAHATSCTLLDNHRMAPALACFCAAPEGIYPAGFVDCSTTAPACPCRNGGRSLPLHPRAERELHVPWLRRALNPAAELVVVRLPGNDDAEEARAAAALLKAASEQWHDAAAFCSEAFVVAPHHRQIALLQGALAREARLARGQLSISTVETVQGREAELVLIQYALTCPDTIAAEAEFLYGLERLNVALTRARQKAVLFITRALVSPDARVAAAAASPTVDEGLAFLRRAAAFSRRRGWHIRLRCRPPAGSDSETDDGADGGFEVDSGTDSDDEGMPAPDPPSWPAPSHAPFGEPRRLQAQNSDEGLATGDDGEADFVEDDDEEEEMAMMRGVDAGAEERSQSLADSVHLMASLTRSRTDEDAAFELGAPPSVRSSERPLPLPSQWESGGVASDAAAELGAAASPPPQPHPQPWRRFRTVGSAPPRTSAQPESAGFSPLPAAAALHHSDSHQRTRPGPGAAGLPVSSQRGPIMFAAADREPQPAARVAPAAESPEDEIEDDSDDNAMMCQ